jgi:hypothetical protein
MLAHAVCAQLDYSSQTILVLLIVLMALSETMGNVHLATKLAKNAKMELPISVHHVQVVSY